MYPYRFLCTCDKHVASVIKCWSFKKSIFVKKPWCSMSINLNIMISNQYKKPCFAEQECLYFCHRWTTKKLQWPRKISVKFEIYNTVSSSDGRLKQISINKNHAIGRKHANNIVYALYRKFETNIPRNDTVRPRSLFLYSCICERFKFSHDWSAYFAVLRLRTDRGNIVGAQEYA